MPHAVILACAAAPLQPVLAGGEPVTRVQLLPMGTIALRDGRGPFHLRDLDHARRVIEETRRRAGRTDIPVDYDHQSVFGAVKGVGGQAPAAGWIRPDSLEADARGIWAEVEWTAAAREALADRRWRYLSPLFRYDEKTGEVVSIENAGLTNSPAIEELMAVAANEERRMDTSAIALALGLAEDAGVDEILAAIAAMKEQMAGAQEAAVSAAVAAATAERDGQLAAARAEVADLASRLATFQEEAASRLVDDAIAAGKLTPAQRAFWLAQAKSKPEETAAYLATAPVILAPGRSDLVPASATPGSAPLTDDELAVARAFGLNPAAFAAAKGA